MNTTVPAGRTPRAYSSPLRDRQTDQTRELILQALTEQLAEGDLRDFNIPRVASRAGVSVRTVYRYFPTKDALVDALEVWVDHRVLTWPKLKKADDLVRLPERQFPIYDQHVQLILAHLASPAGQAVRARGRRKRIDEFRLALEDVTSNLTTKESRAGLAVISYLASGATWKSFREEFGMSGEESAAAVSWALRLIVADLRKMNLEATSTSVRSEKKKEGAM